MASITYQDAVRLLAKDESKLIKVLDQVLGLGLLGATIFNPAGILPYFDGKNEIIEQLHKLTAGLDGRIRRANRVEYERLLTAAHALIVMAAFTEELADTLQRQDEDGKWRSELSRWTRASARTSSRKKQPARPQIVDWSTRTPVHPPGPARPFETVVEDVRSSYSTLGSHALSYIRGLSRWDDLDESQRYGFESTLRSSRFIDRAVARYRENYVRLAAEVPEFLVWTLLNESTASRNSFKAVLNQARYLDAGLQELVAGLKVEMSRLHRLLNSDTAALGDLPSMLATLVQRDGSAFEELPIRVMECNKVHQLVLDKPLLTPRLDAALEDLRFPTNREGYINPHFRLYETTRSDEGFKLAQEEWWTRHRVRSGLGGHLAGYVRSAEATQRPLVVLGDPGSGKSLLSKILAAQLHQTSSP